MCNALALFVSTCTYLIPAYTCTMYIIIITLCEHTLCVWSLSFCSLSPVAPLTVNSTSVAKYFTPEEERYTVTLLHLMHMKYTYTYMYMYTCNTMYAHCKCMNTRWIPLLHIHMYLYIFLVLFPSCPLYHMQRYVHVYTCICRQCLHFVLPALLHFSLLVLGMDHYGLNAWEKIQQNILPTKTLKQVGSHNINYVL